MINLIKTVQEILNVNVDGDIGPKTLKAICQRLDINYNESKSLTVKAIQKKLDVTADGIIGKITLTALIAALDNDYDLIKKYIEKPIQFSKLEYKSKLVKQSEVRSR